MLSTTLKAIEHIIDIEGDYIDHPSDKGGPTRFGITEQVARAYGYKADMRILPRELATDIYLQRYWLDPKFDQVALVSPMLAEELLDTGINMGQATAVKFLQRALNVLNQRATKYPDVVVDGYLGAISLACLETFIQQRGKDGERTLFKMLNAQQSVRYMELAEKNMSQEDFEFGWQNARVA